MSADLPIIPCYEGDNCGTEFNCGDICDADLDNPDNLESCVSNPNYFKGICWGNNPNYCQGVLPFCDPSNTELNCNLENDNPTIHGVENSNKSFMGCNILDQTTFPPGYENTSMNSCMEFKRDIDTQADCSFSCWLNGGYNIAKSLCETKIGKNKNECLAMEYFCEWDESEGMCTLPISRNTNTPLETYEGKYNSKPPPVMTVAIKKDCEGVGMGGDSLGCIEIQDPTYNDNLYVTSSQSSWDSNKQTSYDPNTRINCVHNNETGKKICMTIPKCQYVETTCECGSVDEITSEKCTNYFRNKLEPVCSDDNVPTQTEDLRFMCAKHMYKRIDASGSGATIHQGSGYCTWCKGWQTDNTYSIPEKRSKTLIDIDMGIIPIKRSQIDWNLDSQGNCNNRCENYNECESPVSEEDWNKCIFDLSSGKYGVDYSDSEFQENKKRLLREEGFCYDTSSEENQEMRILASECEQRLENLGSINWGRIFGPNGSETAACQYRYNWYHGCIKPTNVGEVQIAENYLCTWCPSLQCKIGKKDEICSEIVEGDESWNGLPYCDTDSNHGNVVNDNLPENCDCFLPKRLASRPPVPTLEAENNNLDKKSLAVAVGGGGLGVTIGSLLAVLL